MKSLLLSSFILFVLLPIASHAQINDCADAQVVCSDAHLEFNPDGPGFNDFADPDNHEGCITALEQNSAWYYFEIDPAAPPNLVLGFIIHPLGGYGEDYDWALYGPDVDCGDLGFPIRCSSSSFMCGFCPETGMGMGTTDVSEGPGTGDGFVMTLIVQPGQGFYLMIDNWLGTDNGFILEWTDTAAPYLNCAADPPCAVNADAGGNITACEGEILTLDGGVSADSYAWSGTNGGTGLLDDPDIEDPVVTIPEGFTGEITYTITVTEDTCSAEAQMLLTILPAPDVIINPLGPFCENDSPQFLSATPAGGDWSGAVTSSTFNPALLGPGLHTVIYTFSNPVCTVIQEMEIEVYENPTVTIDPNPAEFCDNEGSILLTATGDDGAGGYIYNWTAPNEMAEGNTYSAEYAGAHTVVVTDNNGCTNTATVNVITYPNPDISIIDPGAICNTVPIYTLQAIPPGGEFDGTIIDVSGEIYPNQVAPGTYTVSYTYVDQHNCESTVNINIIIVTSPAAIATNNSPICDGQPINLSGQTDAMGGNITFQWSGPNGYTSNLQNPTDATLAGIYILQVFVGSCPSAPDTTIVTLTTAPDATAVNDGPYCIGEAIHLFGNTNAGGNLTFNWSGPNGYVSNAQNPLDATAAGTYTLVISNGSCSSPVTQTDVTFGAQPDVIIGNTGPYCAGETIQLSGSTNAQGTVINYAWSGPNGYVSTLQNPSDATLAGTYQLVIDVDGCASTPSATNVVINPVPQPVIAGRDTFCTGFSSVLDAGSGYAQYEWSNASTNQSLEVFSSGTFIVTVTDNNGCTGVTSTTVTELSSLSPSITGNLSFCEGSGTVLDAGAGFTNYMWSTGATSQTISVTADGNFGVIVTDADGCTGSANVTTSINLNPNVIIGGSTTYCIGGFSVLDAGAGYASYTWSTGSNNQTLTVSSPGTYSVDVIDAFGCAGSGSVNVTESTSLSPIITGTPAFCEGGTTILNAGTFATYIWSDGSDDQTLNVSLAGTYSVTVSDGQGCSGSSSVPVVEVAPPVATVRPDVTICNTIAGGSILNLYSLIQSGDTGGSWQDADNSGAVGLFTNLNFADITAGVYRFRYTTNSAIAPCPESSYVIFVTVIDCACPDVFFFNTDPLCNASDVLDVSTIENTSEQGVWSIIQTPAGSNPATLNGNVFNSTGSDPGDYTLQFSLQNSPPLGCFSDYQVVISVDASVNAGLPVPPFALCEKESLLISLDVLLTGEDANGTWTETSATPSTGGAFNAINGSFATDIPSSGTYTFEYTVLSGNACPDESATASVIIHPLPQVTIADIGVLDCDHLVTSLDAGGSSNGPEFVINWTGPGVLQDGNEHTLHPTVDAEGNYDLTITNSVTGCSNTTSVSVTANNDPPTDALIDVTDPSCFGKQDAVITADDVIGGAPPYQYSLNNGPFGNSPNFNQLAAGDYTLIVEDANGCKWDTLLTLTEPDEILIDLGPDIELGLGESATVTANHNVWFSDLDTLIWSPDDVIECIDVLCNEATIGAFNSVTLSATVIDIYGCEATDKIFILVDKHRKVYIPTAFSPNGDGINDVFFVMGDDDQIVQVNKLAVYSRWGEYIFEARDFLPNDPSRGWNGLFNEQLLNPGVFVYQVEIEFIDGVTEVYTGDVTIMR